jgi:anthranilate/para-aminobenzoate synthase component II
MRQTRRQSLLEACANVLPGFGVALGLQMVLFPVFGIRIETASHIGLAVAFTVASILRSYALRRFFERWR